MNQKVILDEILENKRSEVAARQSQIGLDDLEDGLKLAPVPRSIPFDEPVSLIAEVKRKSPSHGDFTPALDTVSQARAYQEGGAAAISVLTDKRFFGGSLDDLKAIRAAVTIPVLCKDFILTQYQVYEARASGADLLLLIVAALNDEKLITLSNLTLELGMKPLIEVHDQHEMARAIALGAHLIGINNRDLTDFSVDLVTTEYLAPFVPDDSILVSESGIASKEDVQRVRRAGARAVLVGEALMRSNRPREIIQDLLS